jgi:predicted DNA binding CopG/RHH family protein
MSLTIRRYMSMKKISKQREAEIEKMLKEDGDEGKWDRKELGNDPKHIDVSEYSKSSTGTSIRMPMKLIQDLKRISEKKGIPYQTYIKMVLTKNVRDEDASAA